MTETGKIAGGLVAAACMMLAAGAAAGETVPLPGGAYPAFNEFCRKHFGAEKEELVRATFGEDIKFLDAGLWTYGSERSAFVGFETNLPAKAYVEYGESKRYGARTPEHERHFYLHLHYLEGLKPNATYHYRLVAVDERGKRIASRDATLRTRAIAGAIHVPGDLQGPPYVLSEAGATYVVTKDITADGTAFDVKAKNVTLDLGGHSVTYNNTRTEGLPKRWTVYIEKSGFGVRAMKVPGLKVLNGVIRQGAGNNAAEASSSIGFNPMYLRNGAGNTVAGVTIQYSGAQMVGIKTHWGGGNLHFHHNTFIDTGKEVLSRHGSGCTALQLPGSKDSIPENIKTHHNLVKRTRQMGLSGRETYSNEIYIDSYCINSYGVRRYSCREAHHNRIFGTGYHVVAFAWGSKLDYRDNFIHLEGQKPDYRFKEYGNQISLNGFRLTQYGNSKIPFEDNRYRGNVIIVTSRGGSNSRGVQFAADPYVKDLVFHDNTIKALVKDSASEVSACVVTQGSWKRADTALPVYYRDNAFYSNICHVRFGDGYSTGSNHHFYNCRFVRVGNDPRYRTFKWRQGSSAPSKRHVFRDCVFENGASLESVSPFGSGERYFTVEWTLTVKGRPGAAVSVRDKGGKEVFSGKADAEGLVAVPLAQYRRDAKGKRPFTPHTVKVGGLTKTVTMDGEKQISF